MWQVIHLFQSLNRQKERGLSAGLKAVVKASIGPRLRKVCAATDLSIDSRCLTPENGFLLEIVGRAVSITPATEPATPEHWIITKSHDRGAENPELRTLILITRPRALRPRQHIDQAISFRPQFGFNPNHAILFCLAAPRWLALQNRLWSQDFQEKFPHTWSRRPPARFQRFSYPSRVFNSTSFAELCGGGRMSLWKRSTVLGVCVTISYT